MDSLGIENYRLEFQSFPLSFLMFNEELRPKICIQFITSENFAQREKELSSQKNFTQSHHKVYCRKKLILMLFTSTTGEYGVISYSTSHILKRPDCERMVCSVRLSPRGNVCFVSQSLSGSYVVRLPLSGS